MSQRYRRYFLKTKEAKSLLIEVSEKLNVDPKRILKVKGNVELIETEFARIYIINGKPLLAEVEEKVFPTLIFDEFLASAPRVVVDMGAVSHVCNGANIMAPGIKRIEGEFGVGDFVLIVDEKHGKPIAIGETVYGVNEVARVKGGIVVKNVHFVGDRVWNLIKV
jgi:PUA-domain protein